jgi:hypothetical protein
MIRHLAIGAVVAALTMTAVGSASADPDDPNPFNQFDCTGNPSAVCDMGPYGPNSMLNPASAMSPLNPGNPQNPASPLNPLNPASPLNPANMPH